MLEKVRKDWFLFADMLTAKPVELEYSGSKEITTKKGKRTVLIFLGNIGGRIGDYIVFPSSLIGINDLIDKFGADEKQWKSFICYFAAEGDNIKISLEQ